MTDAIQPHPGHTITVTPGPFGRAYFDCSCGIARTFAAKRPANTAALRHHHDVAGCTCPPEVVAHVSHPDPARKVS